MTVRMPWALTECQREALRLAVRGFTAREIGEALKISENAVQERLKEAAHRMGARNRVQLAGLAVKYGLADPDEGSASVERKRAA